MQDEDFMRRAIELAEKGRFSVRPNPLVGCVLVRDGEIIAEGWHDHLGGLHAEQMAIADAEAKGVETQGSTAYVTLEPCHMCAKAIVDARISNLYFGASESKTGSVQSIDAFFERTDLNHKVNFSGGYMANQSADLLKKFFMSKRCKPKK